MCLNSRQAKGTNGIPLSTNTYNQKCNRKKTTITNSVMNHLALNRGERSFRRLNYRKDSLKVIKFFNFLWHSVTPPANQVVFTEKKQANILIAMLLGYLQLRRS